MFSVDSSMSDVVLINGKKFVEPNSVNIFHKMYTFKIESKCLVI